MAADRDVVAAAGRTSSLEPFPIDRPADRHQTDLHPTASPQHQADRRRSAAAAAIAGHAMAAADLADLAGRDRRRWNRR